ncbi:uncharacterized protein Tco025E_00438 [Trypanosoma conorhini]|uniref:Lipid droplet-associated hydrolase n=1 Tax=Trypanosoma conorhini TaxID=83891 RepID=A0A3R7LHA2_9TRYP|nr:uncharacterized protein Tco025E_00438 [Trypanosoma conorhini]RNF27247.1 hypothetical protein Tco025E_00438 [Trypanosoma conorhini]
MPFPNAIVTWQSPRELSSVVEVLQSCPNLLDCLCETSFTEAMRRPPSPHRRLFILFPGNPGVVQFYERFVELMSVRRLDVLVMGFAGHSVVDQNNGRAFDLQDQVETADHFLHAVFTPYTLKWYGKNIYVGGHSIGAFLALQMLTRFSCIKRCFSLCGVLSNIQNSPNGKRFFFLSSNILLYTLFTYWLALLLLMPRVLFALLLRWYAPTVRPSLRRLLTRHLNQNILWNCFGMARQEFRQVRELDRPLMKAVEDRMVFFYVVSDRWATPQHAREVQELCEGHAGFVMEMDPNIPHAWCLDHNEVVIERGVMPFL